MSTFFKDLGKSVSTGFTGGVGSAISDGIGGLTGQVFAGANARRNWKYKQKEMALQQGYNLQNMEKQQEYIEKNWNMENEYNDPSKVAARYQSAGISKQAAFGQGSAGGAGISGSMATPSSDSPSGAGSYDHSPQFSGASGAVSVMNLQKDNEVKDSVIRKNDAETKEILGETDPQQKDMEFKTSAIAKNLADAKQSEAKTQTEQSLKRYYQLQNDFMDATMQDRIDQQTATLLKMWEDAKVAGENANQMRFKTDHQKTEFWTNISQIKSSTAKNIADTSLKQAQTAVAQMDEKQKTQAIDESKALVKKLGLESDYQEWYNTMKKNKEFTGSTIEFNLIVSQIVKTYGDAAGDIIKTILTKGLVPTSSVM